MIIKYTLLICGFVLSFATLAQSSNDTPGWIIDIDTTSDIVKECENKETLKFSYNPDKDDVSFPELGKYCYMTIAFNDYLSASDALQDLEKEFVHLASKYAGTRAAHYAKIKQGALIDDIYITAYVKNAKIDRVIRKRWVSEDGDKPWNIKVGFNATVKRSDLEKKIEELFYRFQELTEERDKLRKLLSGEIGEHQEDVARQREIIQQLEQQFIFATELRKRDQEIKRELEQDNLRLTHEREQLLEKLSWYSEYVAWIRFGYSIGAHSDAVVIRQFERFCSSTNEQVKALCNRKRMKFFEDKHRLKEFIDYATIEVKQGRATPNLYNKLGVAIWLSDGSLLDAQNYFDKALKHPALKDRDLKRNITYNLATVLGHQGQYTKAVNYLNEAEKSFTLDPAGRVLRAALRSRESQALVCKDLRLACGNEGNKRFCDNWERAKEIGDCSETVTPLDEDILQSITHSD